MGQNAVTVAALALLIAYLYLQRAHIGAHYEFSLGKLLALAGLVVLTLVLRGMANRLIFARLGAIAPLRDWFAIVSVSALSSYLPASTGLVSKAHFLKRAHSVTYRQFAVGQVTLLVLSIATHGAVGLVTLALWRPAAAVWIAIVFAAMSAAGSLVLLPERAAQFARGRWLPLDTATIARMRVSFPSVIALQIGVLLATACALDLGFSMGPADVSFAACMVFSAGTVLTRLVWVTPGGLGVREFLVGGLAVVTGFELRDAVIASVAVRLAEIGATLALGSFSSLRLAHQLSTIPDEPAAPRSSGT